MNVGSRRPRTAGRLIALAVILLGSVVLGRVIGQHALVGLTQQRDPQAEPSTTPIVVLTPGSDATRGPDWKRERIVSVPSDPAFPEPTPARPRTRQRPAGSAVVMPTSGDAAAPLEDATEDHVDRAAPRPART